MKKIIPLIFLAFISCKKDSQDDFTNIIEPPSLNYILSVSAVDGGTVNTSGGEYEQGTSVTLTATPNTGYTFTGWSGNASGTNSSLNITIIGNINVTANFEPISYTLTVDSGSGGAVSSSGGVYDYGTQVTLSAIPDSGYGFVNWSNGSTEQNITVTISENTTLTANFEIGSYTLTVDSGSGGAVSSSGGTYDYGTQVTLSAIPDSGYGFVNWSNGSTEQNITVTISENTTLTANFEIGSYTLTVDSGAGGAVSSSGGTYDDGAQVSITATADSGYSFSSWSDGSTEQSRTITITQDTTLTANFSENTSSSGGTTASYTLAVSSGAGGSVSSTGGTYDDGAQVSITATADSGYSFSSWSDGSTEQSRTITITQDTTLTANFSENTSSSGGGSSGSTTTGTTTPSYTLSVTAESGGSVNTSGGEYEQGASVTITATPNTGYTFTGWSGNATGSDTSLTITINGNTSVTANFEVAYTLTVNAGTGGSVSSSGGTYTPETQVTLSATPDTGFSFVSWSDGSTEQSRTITLSENTTLTANFEAVITYTLTLCGNNNVGNRGSIKNPWTTGEWDGGTFYSCQDFTYASGTQVNISPVPDQYHVFKNWSDGSTDQNRTITMDSQKSMAANFEYATYTVTLISYVFGSENTGGSVSGGGTYQYGTQVNISATPNTGYEFRMWMDQTDTNLGPQIYTENHTFEINRDVTFRVEFSAIYSIAVNAGPGGSASATMVEGLGFSQNEDGTYDNGTQFSLSATPDSGYVFTSWSDSSTDQNRTISLTDNTTLTANFCPSTGCEYSLQVDNGGYGSVNNLGGNYVEGTEITITVEPFEGWTFDSWSGDISSSSSEITFTMNSDISIVANYNIITVNNLAIILEVQGNGCSSCHVQSSGSRVPFDLTNAGQTRTVRGYNTGEQVTLTASPTGLNTFVEWECTSGCSGNTFGTNATLVLTIGSSDIRVIAKFQ